MKSKVKYFKTNEIGTDYVVGDIHGCYDEFMELLNRIGFDKSKDRMFSVGDLLDRGKDSIKCLELIYEHWFHSVRGNHEDMMIESLHSRHIENTWLYNGGGWSRHEDEQLLTAHCEWAKENLPIVIVVGKEENRRNIVHAEFYKNANDEFPSDKDIDEWNFDEYNENNLLWGRVIISNKPLFSTNSKFSNEGLSPTFVGHTPLSAPLRLFNHIYIDTGAVFKRGNCALTVSRLSDFKMFSIDTSNSADKIPYREYYI